METTVNTETTPETVLAKITGHLAVAGNVVMVSTYYKAVKFTSKHAGGFAVLADGHLAYRSGKSWNRIVTPSGRVLVSVRFSRMV
jgi:hypothetical protein